MKPRVYLETSIFSYLAARPSRDLVIAAHQQITHTWWSTRLARVQACVSGTVIEEASAGDPDAAARRLALIAGLLELDVSDRAAELAGRIVRESGLPSSAGVDALHVAVAAVEGCDLLLTWNCRHIASATLAPRIESVCVRAGFTPPRLTTPTEDLEPRPC
jgi:predicted nucleic acid-binding protein